MLTQIKIFDFQKHERLVIDIDEPILCITGKTDSGKSSIIRALKFALLNKAPSSYLRHGAETARVKVKIDGHTITRRKGAENTYQLDKESFKAFATDVPDEIARLVNIGATSFQSQHDGSYWLSLPAGQVSRELNNIVNLSEIDGCLSAVASELRTARATVSVTESRLASARQRRDELAYISDIDNDLKEIEQAYSIWQETAQESSRINSVLSRLGSYQTERQEASDAASDALAVCQAFERMQEAAFLYGSLEKLIQDIEKCEREASIQVGSTEHIDRAIAEWRETQSQLDRLNRLIEELERWERAKTDADRNWSNLSQKLQTAAKGKCPICGGKLPTT